MKILVTGAAGFIGYHLAQRLLSQGEQVYGIDNLNDYYDVNLKKDAFSSTPIPFRIYFSAFRFERSRRHIPTFPKPKI
jgi:Nucleoside-diphosphate-sugar epimerases